MQTFSSSNTCTSTTQSAELFKRAQHVIPGGVNSPVRAFKAIGGTPRFIKAAKGAYLIDVDDNQYIDYVGSWGPMILGHAHPAVIQAVQETSAQGLSFGAPSPLEVTLATTICQRLPSIEQIRLVNSGTEATMSAIRLARAVTSRNKIIKFAGCYHGHADCLLVEAGSGALTLGHPSSPGVPSATVADTLVANFNDLDSVSRLFERYSNDIAAVIVEPIAGNMNLIMPQPNFLPGLRKLCTDYHALLILDEVMTGFRVHAQSAQGLFNVIPDLTTLGKIIGGGMPVGAFGGRRDIMQQISPQGPVYQAGTLSGNPLAMAAGLATLNLLQPPDYQQLNTLAEQLCHGLQQAADAASIPLCTQYCGGMWGFFFTEKTEVDNYADSVSCNSQHFNQFFHGMLEQGIYLAPSRFETNFLSLAHQQADIDKTLTAARYVFNQMKIS